MKSHELPGDAPLLLSHLQQAQPGIILDGAALRGSRTIRTSGSVRGESPVHGCLRSVSPDLASVRTADLPDDRAAAAASAVGPDGLDIATHHMLEDDFRTRHGGQSRRLDLLVAVDEAMLRQAFLQLLPAGRQTWNRSSSACPEQYPRGEPRGPPVGINTSESNVLI